MSDLLRRMAPGVAIGAVALGVVAGFDTVLHPAASPRSGGATSAQGDADGSATGCTDGTELTGDSVATRWGPVQVVATVTADGTICQSDAVVYPNNDHRSSEINAYAIPAINQDVLNQGVSFDTVSGATYTSEAYRQSLQSILDQL